MIAAVPNKIADHLDDTAVLVITTCYSCLIKGFVVAYH